jgi:cbb3-type cytochrome oxidase subunit 3
MSEGDWTECFGNILAAIGLALLIQWALANPFWATALGTSFLSIILVAVPLYIFTKNVALNNAIEARQKIKWGIVVGWLIGFFAMISSILFNVVRGLFAMFGVVAFVAPGIFALAYYIIKDSAKRSERAHAKALIWELKDQMQELKEQLNRGVITQEAYEQKTKLLKDQLEQLKAQARARHL